MDENLYASLTNFAARFCNEQDKSRSSVCSPLSAQTVLALTALGCVGASRAELLAAMGLHDDDNIRSSFSFLTSRLKAIEGVTLKMANRVYVTKEGTLKASVQKDAVEVFQSELEQLDFEQAGAAADRINKWVADETNNMIKGIVSPGDLSGNTGLVLVNAIYFQGFWKTQFLKESTKPRTFYVNKSTEIEVPMMSLEDTKFDYMHSSELKAKIMRMLYVGDQTSMLIVLPDEVEGLADLMQQLASGYDLNGEISGTCGLRRTPLDLMIPKFKVETDIDLKQLLPKLGIKTIFNKHTAGIQMLESSRRQYVSKAVQRTVIEVDESGTKAAVHFFDMVTFISTNWKPPEKQQFIADHPFLYVLMVGFFPLFIGVYQGSGCTVPERETHEECALDLKKKVEDL